jgi:Ca2+-binding RTX toxin-like protein
VCRGRRANVFLQYRVGGYGRPGPGPDVAVGDYYIGGNGGDDLLCAGGIGDGGRGDDAIYGRSGNNRLDGGPGDDRLVGGAGADQLVGGSGFDVCIGGRGHDTFTGCERRRQE